MATDTSTHLVKVLDIETKKFKSGEYKCVLILEEQGYWAQKFLFNIFPDSSFYNNVNNGDKLRITVKPYTRNYKTLLEGESANFSECKKCHRYHQEVTCNCTNKNVSIRIQGQCKSFPLDFIILLGFIYFQFIRLQKIVISFLIETIPRILDTQEDHQK